MPAGWRTSMTTWQSSRSAIHSAANTMYGSSISGRIPRARPCENAVAYFAIFARS